LGINGEGLFTGTMHFPLSDQQHKTSDATDTKQ